MTTTEPQIRVQDTRYRPADVRLELSTSSQLATQSDDTAAPVAAGSSPRSKSVGSPTARGVA